MRPFTLSFVALIFCVGAPVALAQTSPPAVPPQAAFPAGQDVPGQQEETVVASIHPNDMQSLLFTYWEHTAIKDARRARGSVRAPTEAELTKDLQGQEGVEKVKPPPEERDISLGGILYVSTEDWTIWLNGMRVTPKAIPKEVIDLYVYGEYIELKWYDEWSNQVFPIRLRPHQRFNIDTRIFLPG